MAQRHNRSAHAATTLDLSSIAALRRQLDEIERDMKNNDNANARINKIGDLCNVMQSETKEALARTTQRELAAHDDLQYYTKRTKEINEVIQALRDAESVDACFLMDCTKSMLKYIEEVKERIFETVELLKQRFPHLKLRLAFVGYRDFNLPQTEQFSVLNFTNEAEFHSFVSSVECACGRDYCEDVLGGLQKTIELNWKQPVRILMHVGDAPSHGRQYHDFIKASRDAYLDYDSNGNIGYSHMQELIALGVKYYFGRLTPHTDKMIEQFRKHAENQMTIEQVEVGDFRNLLPFIVESISRSISDATASLLKKHSEKDGDSHHENHTRKVKSYRVVTFDEKEPDWSTVESIKMRVVKYECNRDLCCQEVIQCWLIKIAKNPFAEGGMRVAYYGLVKYREDWEKTVFKEYKTTGTGSNTKDKYLELLDCQTVADYLAREFNKLPEIADKTAVVKKIKFIMSKLVFQPLSDGKYRNMTMERFIEGSYKKFSNNAGYVNYDDPALTLQAFSHWTYEHTNGNMLVVDLQGITIDDNQTYLLTDPCIHSPNLKRFGKANLGKLGIKRFFQTHICNVICFALKLKRNEHQPEINATKYEKYFVNKPNVTMFN